jgi:mono/diheme cytochrome c family protein
LVLPFGRAAENPRQLWADHCVSCHGPTGNGATYEGRKRHVRDYTDPKVQAKFDDAGLLKNLMLGIADADGKPRMPSFKDRLTIDEAKALIAVIREFGKNEARP